MAAAIFNKIAEEKKIDAEASSAGMYAPDGSPASVNAIEAMREAGIDMTLHRARTITREMLEDADLIMCMTPAHRNILIQQYPGYEDRIECFIPGISDPYGGDLEVYRQTAQELIERIESSPLLS